MLCTTIRGVEDSGCRLCRSAHDRRAAGSWTRRVGGRHVARLSGHHGVAAAVAPAQRLRKHRVQSRQEYESDDDEWDPRADRNDDTLRYCDTCNPRMACFVKHGTCKHAPHLQQVFDPSSTQGRGRVDVTAFSYAESEPILTVTTYGKDDPVAPAIRDIPFGTLPPGFATGRPTSEPAGPSTWLAYRSKKKRKRKSAVISYRRWRCSRLTRSLSATSAA